MGVQIEKKEIITVRDDCGQVVSPGDFLMMRVGKEDVVCRFKGIEAGYFKTQHLFDDETVKYRNASIESIYHIDITTINTKED